VEDDSSFCDLLKHALSKVKSIELVSIHDNAEDALREIPQLKPDVVLMDNKLPGMNGVECLRRLKKVSPPLLCHVLMLTEYEGSDLVFEALKAGASGYLLKGRISAREISVAIKEVAAGAGVMSPNIAGKVIRYFHAPPTKTGVLTKREGELLADLSEGMTYKEIAAKRAISVDTVRSHLGSIYRKLHARSRTDAVRHYFQRPR